MVSKSCAMAACLSCLDGLGLVFGRASDSDPKVDPTVAHNADAEEAGMQSLQVESGAVRIKNRVIGGLGVLPADADTLAVDINPASMEPSSIEHASIETSNMEPMKIHVRAKSEDFSLFSHMQVRGAFPAPSTQRAMSMQDAWPAFPLGPEMLADHHQHFAWAPLQAVAPLNPGSMMHGTGTCSPCAWFWKPKTCLNATDCPFCHLCPEGELKSRRKTKLAVMRNAGFPPRSRSQQSVPSEETPQKSKSCQFGDGEASPQKTSQVLSLSSLL